MATVPELEKKYLHGADLCKEIASLQGNSDTVMLSFSGGKDSLASWLEIRKHFDRVVPYYLYMVPGLSFVEDWLDRCAERYGHRVVRLPHYHFYKMLTDHVYQSPDRVELHWACNWPTYNFEDCRRVICEDLDLAPETYYATGVRAPDSPMRMTAISKYGPITHSQNKFHAVWNWTKGRLIDEFRANDVKLPVDYRLFSRSWDGVDLRFSYRLKQYYPDDYQKILDWFPLAEVQFSRYEFHIRKKKLDDLRRGGASEALIHAQVMQLKREFPIKYSREI